MAITQAVEEKKVDFSVYVAKYLVPVLERKWIVVSSLVICFFLSAVLAYMIKPEYVSEAILQTSEPFSATTKQSNQEAYVWTRLATRYIIAEAKKLQSPAFCSRVVKALPQNAREDLKTPLKLTSQLRSTFSGLFDWNGREGVREPISTAEEDRLVMELVKRLVVTTDPDVGLILLKVKAVSKTVAPILLNHSIELSMAANEEENKLSVKSERQFVQSEKDRADMNLDEAERDFVSLLEFEAEYMRKPWWECDHEAFERDLARRRAHCHPLAAETAPQFG